MQDTRETTTDTPRTRVDEFLTHTYLDRAFVADHRRDRVSVYRDNSSPGNVVISMDNYESGFGFYAKLTTDKAEAIGQALLDAAKASRKLTPIESNMGPMQLMVADAVGMFKAVTKGGAA